MNQTFHKISIKIIRILFLFGPPMVCFFILFHFTLVEFNNSNSESLYELIIGAIGITATLSGLTFRLSSIIKDDNDKAEKYKEIGERFLHTAILILFCARRDHPQNV